MMAPQAVIDAALSEKLTRLAGELDLVADDKDFAAPMANSARRRRGYTATDPNRVSTSRTMRRTKDRLRVTAKLR